MNIHSALCASEGCFYLTYYVAMSGKSHDRQGNDESHKLQISIIPVIFFTCHSQMAGS